MARHNTSASGGIKLSGQRDTGSLLNQLLPVAQLVPGIYSDWRPVIQDAIHFIATHLSHERLIPKLAEQESLPANTLLSERLLRFIAHMPTLQKLGQVIARNRNLEPGLRSRLIRLENSIHDVTVDEILTEIKRQSGPLLKTYHVELAREIYAEASVSAVLGFTWLNPDTMTREQGVFKVLKPRIEKHLREELRILQQLSEYIVRGKYDYILTQADLPKLFADIRKHLEQEINFINEQANLNAAMVRHANTPGVRTPRLIQELSTASITAMTLEPGRKVTEAYPDNPAKRIVLSKRIIRTLIATPLFSSAEHAVFHADPHAGNLFVDEQTHELVILDWALTERLNRNERRQILMLVAAVMLRDEQLVFNAISALLEQHEQEDSTTRHNLILDQITNHIDALTPLTIPETRHVLALLDDIILTGARFSTSLLIFRKVLLTLDGILHDVSGSVPLEEVLAEFMTRQMLSNLPGSNIFTADTADLAFPLTGTDTLALFWSMQSYTVRSCLRTSEQIIQNYFNMYGNLFAVSQPGTVTAT